MFAGGVNFSAMGVNGGTVFVPYLLTSGPQVPGLSTGYWASFTVGDLTGTGSVAGNDYRWLQPFQNQTVTSGMIGVVPELGSLMTALPANNLESLNMNDVSPTTAQSVDGWFQEKIALGTIDLLGTFTVTSGAAPTAPAGYQIVQDALLYYSNFNAYFETNGIAYGGIWAAPQGAPNGPGNASSSGSITVQHGGTTTFDFTAFDDPADSRTFGISGRGLWNAYGFVAYDTVPEPAGALMATCSCLLLWKRRRD